MLDGAVMKRNALPLKGKHECTPPEREARVNCTPPEREGALAAVADVGVTTAASDNCDSDNHRVQHGWRVAVPPFAR